MNIFVFEILSSNLLINLASPPICSAISIYSEIIIFFVKLLSKFNSIIPANKIALSTDEILSIFHALFNNFSISPYFENMTIDDRRVVEPKNNLNQYGNYSLFD